jgi:hypothetical protein
MLLNLERGVLSAQIFGLMLFADTSLAAHGGKTIVHFKNFSVKNECGFFQQGEATTHMVSNSVPTLPNIFWDRLIN